MDCAQFDLILHDLDRPGTRGAAMCELAFAHAESCNRCAELLNQSECLDFNLLRLKGEISSKQVPAHVESALLQEFRRVNRESARRTLLHRAALIGAAAAVLAALGFSLRPHQPAPAPGTPSASNLPAVAPTPIPSSSARGNSLTAASSPAHASIVPANRSAANSEADSADYAASFMPLPYADDSLADEDATIVRVQISRAALASFGLPVIEGDGAEPLYADLLLSADGTPQAIRLLSESEPAAEF